MKLYIGIILIVFLLLGYYLYNTRKRKIKPHTTIIQTIKDKSTIPNYIHEAFAQHAKGMSRTVYDDNECRAFLLNHFGKTYADKFDYMTLGCHKADFFRYAYLYVHGGIYLDIKCVPLHDLRETFRDDRMTYCVEAFNGIIATPPKNRLMLDCLNDLLLYDNIQNREVPCQNYERIITTNTKQQRYVHGLNLTVDDIPDIFNYAIHQLNDCDKKDRWGFCKQYILNERNQNLIQLRDLDYVPNYNVDKKKRVYTFDEVNKIWKIE